MELSVKGAVLLRLEDEKLLEVGVGEMLGLVL